VSRNEAMLKPAHPSVFVAMTIGFCGSCTTFSTWMVEAGAMMWTPSGEDGQHNWPQQVIRALLLVLIGFLCLMSSLHVGQWVGDFMAEKIQQRRDRRAVAADTTPQEMGTPLAGIEAAPPTTEPLKPLCQREKSFVYWTVVMAFWCGAALLYVPFIHRLEGSEDAGTKQVLDLFAGMCLAPFGAWLRFALAKCNARSPSFPVGTLAANMIGTAMSITCWILAASLQCQDHPQTTRVGRWLETCTWLAANSGGFCGCLTTASTWANELDKLSRNKGQVSTKALRYGLATVVLAQAIIAIAVNTYFVTR
jgi:fluoride ion exporter CrcB/FEX